MPVGPNPIEEPEEFNKLQVWGTANPGLFKLLDGGGRPYKWMIQDPPGMQGALLIYRGWKLSDNIKLQFQFWQAEQIQQYYQQFDPLLSYDARKLRPKPIFVYHPVLAYNNVVLIVIKEKGPLKDLGAGLWSVTHDACEYRKPPRINVTTKPEDPNTRNPSIEDKQDSRIAELLALANKPLPDNSRKTP